MITFDPHDLDSVAVPWEIDRVSLHGGQIYVRFLGKDAQNGESYNGTLVFARDLDEQTCKGTFEENRPGRSRVQVPFSITGHFVDVAFDSFVGIWEAYGTKMDCRIDDLAITSTQNWGSGSA